MLVIDPHKKLRYFPGARQYVGDIRTIPICTEVDRNITEHKEVMDQLFFREKYDSDGFDSLGFDKDGYDKDGINFDGYNRKGEKVRESPFEGLRRIFADN